jgi:tryptophan synthase alpha chain
MSKYKTLFDTLAKKQEGAFIPFTLVGYPNADDFLKSIDIMVDAGADALELGLPFSDPVADGPIIQAANVHTLKQGLTSKQAFALIAEVSQKYPTLPIGLLVYGNLVFSGGVQAFYEKAKAAGVSSMLVADVPSREVAPFKKAAENAGVEQVLIAPPNASNDALKTIASLGAGYTYVLGRAGITGTHEAAKIPSLDFIMALETLKAPPLVAGFGFSEPDGVRTAIKAGLKGVISGSAIVKRIPKTGLTSEAEQDLSSFCKTMKDATVRTSKTLKDKGSFQAA